MSAQGWRLAGLLFGLALPIGFSNLPDGKGLLALALLAYFLAWWPRLRILGFVLAGIVLCSAQLTWLIEKQLPQTYEGEDIPLTLSIASLPETNDRSTRFIAEIIDAPEDFAWRGRLRLNWYRAPELRVDERWHLLVRLKRPRGFVNPGNFDYQAWLLSQKIFATGYVRKARDNRRIERAGLTHEGRFFEKLRESIHCKLFANTELASARFLRALLIGDKADIEQADWHILQATGTVHLMAISGLHVGLIAGFGFFLGRACGRVLAPSCVSVLATKLCAPLGSVFSAFIYAGLAGFSIPTQRALLFVILVNLAFLLGRRINYFQALIFCACAVAIYDPFVWLAPGFYLSFAAVAVLFWCFMGRRPYRQNRWSKTFVFAKAQVVLFVGLFLPLSLLGLPVSAMGLLTNSLAIPVVGFAVVPLLFIAAASTLFSQDLAMAVLELADAIFSVLWLGLGWFAKSDWSFFHYSVFHPVLLAVLAVLALVLLAPRSLALRGLLAPLCIVLFFLPRDPNEFELTVLDVGQGLAVFVDWPQGNLLYDTGARFSSDFDVGSRVIVPWLRNRGVESLDFLVVSHGDNDHAGGLRGVLSSMRVANLWLGPSVKAHGLGREALDCNRNTSFVSDDLEIRVLWPGPATERFANSNNSSCVLLLNYRGTSVLFAGDIEKDVERQLLNSGVLPEDVDLLIAPHHGSRSSSTRAFVEQLAAKNVVFSAGYRNRYHHPNPEVQQRYRESGAGIFRTDRDGAISFSLDTSGELQARRARVDNARAWFW